MNKEMRVDMLTAAMQSLHAAADILQDLGEETLSLKIRNQANNVAAKQRQAAKAAAIPTQPGDPRP
tara:strand:+ start:402 stop:599 length:198 start_codon:yes stop_codon:yes gene_type:complete